MNPLLNNLERQTLLFQTEKSGTFIKWAGASPKLSTPEEHPLLDMELAAATGDHPLRARMVELLDTEGNLREVQVTCGEVLSDPNATEETRIAAALLKREISGP